MIKRYTDIFIDPAEAARYLGYGRQKPEEKVQRLIEETIEALALDCKVCMLETDVQIGECVDLGCMQIQSRSLANNLKGCKKAVLFGATIGMPFDRMLKKTAVLSPSRAVILQAVGTAAIESLCDRFCDELGDTRPRFSPGYGDVPLKTQISIFKVLDLHKNIGISLTDSLLMVPTKSVTAIVGLGKRPQQTRTGCADCTKPCAYRKEE